MGTSSKFSIEKFEAWKHERTASREATASLWDADPTEATGITDEFDRWKERKASQLTAELQRLEAEKSTYLKQWEQRASDVTKLLGLIDCEPQNESYEVWRIWRQQEEQATRKLLTPKQ